MKGTFNVIHAKGYIMTREVGAPMLPVRIVNLVIPIGTDVGSIAVDEENSEVMAGSYHIYPVQPPTLIYPDRSPNNDQAQKFVEPNQGIYNSTALYPSNPVMVESAGYFDGARIVRLRVFPFEYSPADGKLTMITRISFTLNPKPSVDKPIHIYRRSQLVQNERDKELRLLVDNPEDIPKYQQRPGQVYSDNPIAFNKAKGEKLSSTSSITYAPYMIITSSSLAPAFTDFVNQKAADGITVSVVTTDYIYANYYGDEISSPPIYDNAGSIREFLLDAYEHGCEWVLIGGDQSVVPIRYTDANYTDGEYIPSDEYYSDLHGNWNSGNWSPSLYPELNVGRVPLDNSQDIINWTNKVIQYERHPFPWDPRAVTRTLWDESDQMCDGNQAEDAWSVMYNTTSGSAFSDLIIREQPNGSSASPTCPSGDSVINALNNGYGIWNIYNHGSPDRVAVRTGLTDAGNEYPYNGYPKWGVFSYDSLEKYADAPYVAGADTYAVEEGNALDNSTNNCTLVYSVACMVGCYDSTAKYDWDPVQDEDCMAKAFLRVNGGGPAFIGNTRDGLVDDGMAIEDSFLIDVFQNGITYIGNAEALSKSQYGNDGLIWGHTLFGDPSMKIWTTAPSNHITAGTWHITTLNNVIPAGVTIYVDPGATIEFDPGANLTVYGTLIADGTASQPITLTSYGGTTPGSWGSIVFSGSGANNSTLQYCNIRYGTTIQVNNTSNVTIENCNIMNSSSYGIYSTSSSNLLAQSDTIANSNVYDGILIFGGSTNNCYENAVFKYQGGQGIGIVYSASGGNVGGNDVYSYGWGISAMYGSSLTSYDPYYAGGYNRIADCLENLVVYQNSYADFGEYDVDYDGQNSIYGNANLIYNADIGYEYPSVPAGVYAYYDWWGSNPPDASLFNVGSACYFYYDDWLGSDPWGNVPLPSARQVTGSGTRIAYAASKVNNPSVGVKSSSNSVALQDSILIGIRLREQNKFSEAMNYFLSYVGRHPEDPAGYVELYGCTNDTTLPDILNFFKTPSTKAPAIEEFLLGNLYQMENQPDLAVQVNNNIIADYPNNPLAVKAETNNMLIDLYDKNDLNGAEALLATIKTQANLISPMELQDAEEAVALYSGRPAAGAQASSQSSKSTSASTTPKSFGLAQNYPNPFNPSTILRYEIPKAGRVEVTVYDILGRVVETLVDEYEQAGVHSVQFNGERLASGVYFYRLTAPGIMQVKKMLLLK